METTATELSRDWPLDDVVVDTVLQRHSTRTTCLIQAAQGRFIVKRYQDASALGLVDPSVAQIDRQLSVLDFLEERGFGYAPRLLRTRSGARFIRSDGWTIVVQAEIPGSRPANSNAIWAELGRIAARLNAITDYPHAYPIAVRSTMIELAQAARDIPFERELRELVATLHVLEGQPKGLIHSEVNIANAVRSPDGRLSLLDWDQAGTGPRVLEAGYPLLTSFLTEELIFHAELATAFYGAYTSAQSQSGDWPDLVFTAAILHALRYLPFGDPPRRWARIRFALAHRDEIVATIANASTQSSTVCYPHRSPYFPRAYGAIPRTDDEKESRICATGWDGSTANHPKKSPG